MLTLVTLIRESGLRKITSLLLIQAGDVLLALHKVIDGEQFVTLTVAIIAGIVGGNVLEHYAKRPNATPLDKP